MVRLFVGLELSQELKQSLQFARGGVEGAHWQSDAQLHLTLAFIGEVPSSAVVQIEEALADIHFDPFELALEGVNMFGSTRQPKTLWAGVANEAPLQHLHDKVQNALERVGMETDRRRYKPHVTLARFPRSLHAKIGDWLTANGVLRTPAQPVGYFSLFSSQRSDEGPCYLVEARFGDGMTHDVNFEFVECRELETL